MQINSHFISDASIYRPSESDARAQSAARQRNLDRQASEVGGSRREQDRKSSVSPQPAISNDSATLSTSKAISAPRPASHINFYRSLESADLSKRNQDALATYRRNSVSPFSIDGKSEFIGIDVVV